MKPDIQARMFAELRSRDVFEHAHRRGLEYVEAALDRHVYPTEAALAGLARFDEAMPDEPGNAVDIIELLHSHGSPATLAQLGGRYFGFVNGSAVPTGLAAKTLATFWDQNTAMQVISPIAARLESVVEGWLRELFNLPQGTVAGFVSGTSQATLCGLAAGRYRLLERAGWNIGEQGLFDAPKLRIVTGRDAHSTVMKAIGVLGLGKQSIEWVDVDEQGRLVASAVPALDERTLVILQAGNVNSGAFDPIAEVCERARRAGAWVHIDGAFGLWAAAAGQLSHLTRGIELADSWSVDGHKTLNTPYDCGIALCRDGAALSGALHMSGGYLVLGAGRDSMFYTPEMSRRARIVELWATMKYLGRSGIDAMIQGMHERARQFAAELSRVQGFTVLNDVVFNQVLVKCASDDLTDRTCAGIQQLRDCWVGGSVWKGARVIRISVCSWATTAADVSRSVRSFEKALRAAEAGRR